jgi:hypothetical protein
VKTATRRRTVIIRAGPETFIDDLVNWLIFLKGEDPGKDRIRLIFSGKLLEEGRKISDYSLKSESVLDVVIRQRSGPGSFTVITPSGSEIFLGGMDEVTVEHFKWHVYDKLGHPCEKQVLKLNGTVL